jgi:hypothetical protein
VLGHTQNIAACDAVLVSAPEYTGLFKFCYKTIEKHIFTFCVEDFFRSVFVWDMDQLKAWPEGKGTELDSTKCLILIANIEQNQMNHVELILATPKHKWVKAKIIFLITSEEEVLIDKTRQLIILMHINEPCCPKITSLCPTVGTEYSEKHNGVCPISSNSLVGKSIKVSYIGIEPYVYMREIAPRGSDIQILNILAKKFQFKMYSLRFVYASIQKQINWKFGYIECSKNLCF